IAAGRGFKGRAIHFKGTGKSPAWVPKWGNPVSAGGKAARLAVQKFAILGRLVGSELLNQSHTSNTLILVSL
ncbi:MAG: hypothetical protein ACRECO_20585, partial [Xanthobacteraceae bacterium]